MKEPSNNQERAYYAERLILFLLTAQRNPKSTAIHSPLSAPKADCHIKLRPLPTSLVILFNSAAFSRILVADAAASQASIWPRVSGAKARTTSALFSLPRAHAGHRKEYGRTNGPWITVSANSWLRKPREDPCFRLFALPGTRSTAPDVVSPLSTGLGACRELAPSKQESTTYEPSPVCKLLILGCRLLIPDRLLGLFRR